MARRDAMGSTARAAPARTTLPISRQARDARGGSWGASRCGATPPTSSRATVAYSTCPQRTTTRRGPRCTPPRSASGWRCGNHPARISIGIASCAHARLDHSSLQGTSELSRRSTSTPTMERKGNIPGQLSSSSSTCGGTCGIDAGHVRICFTGPASFVRGASRLRSEEPAAFCGGLASSATTIVPAAAPHAIEASSAARRQRATSRSTILTRVTSRPRAALYHQCEHAPEGRAVAPEGLLHARREHAGPRDADGRALRVLPAVTTPSDTLFRARTVPQPTCLPHRDPGSPPGFPDTGPPSFTRPLNLPQHARLPWPRHPPCAAGLAGALVVAPSE